MGIWSNQYSSLSQAKFLSILNNCYIASRSFPGKDQIIILWCSSQISLLIHIFRNSMHTF